MHSPSVLIIEDDPVLLRGLRDNFESQAYRVQLARDGREGLSAALANPPALSRPMLRVVLSDERRTW